MTQEIFQYSWERQTIWETPEVLQEPLSDFAENSEDLLPIWELEDEEPFISLEESPDMEDWLMSNV
jgi:hypothetical protein